MIELLLAASWMLFAQAGAVLHGRVINAESGVPLPDVRVVATLTADDRRATSREWTAATSGAGTFAFDNLPAGTYSVSFTTVGYIFVRRTVELGPGQTVDLAIPLTEGTGAYRESVNVA